MGDDQQFVSIDLRGNESE